MIEEKELLIDIYHVLKLLKYKDIDFNFNENNCKAINPFGKERNIKIQIINEIKTILVLADFESGMEVKKTKTFCLKFYYKNNKFMVFDYL